MRQDRSAKMLRMCLVLLALFIVKGWTLGLDQMPSQNIVTTYGIHGGAALLNCTHGIQSGPVMWLHPHTGEPISTDYSVLAPLAERISIVGNPRRGQYNLLIRYTTFPDDQGEWSCVMFGGKTQTTKLTILVAPVGDVPVVTPSYISVLDVRNDAWTFTCTSHFANPPVNLSWIKLGGPEVQYDATPPSYLIAPDSTMSVSSKLIVTSFNFGSVFACIAAHPTFSGQPRMKQVYFQENSPQALQLVHEVAEDKIEAMQPPPYKLDRYDLSMMMIITVMAGIVLVSGGCILRHKNTWAMHFEAVETVPIRNNNKSDGSSNNSRKLKRRCLCKIVTASVLCVILVTALCLTIPLYLKGITPTPRGVDELTSVVAGSALWLDCSSMAFPLDSVLQLSWSKNHQRFYKQYYVNDQNIGFPNNSTLGYVIGTRVKPVTMGQISIWPMLPGEEGMYSCEVLLIESDTGRTKVRHKSFGVFVITGRIMNVALIVLLAICITCAVCLGALVFAHSSLYFTKSCTYNVKKKQKEVADITRDNKPNGDVGQNKDVGKSDTSANNELQPSSGNEATSTLLVKNEPQNVQANLPKAGASPVLLKYSSLEDADDGHSRNSLSSDKDTELNTPEIHNTSGVSLDDITSNAVSQIDFKNDSSDKRC